MPPAQWRLSILVTLALALSGVAVAPGGAGAQSNNCELENCQRETEHPLGRPGTANIEVVGHQPLPGERFSHADIDIEQDLSRPFAYVAERLGQPGFYAIGLDDPSNPRILYRWVIDNPSLHSGSGAVDIRHFKVEGRSYVAVSFEFQQGAADGDLGAAIFDVTGLPDPSSVEKVAELRVPEYPGGFHNIFAYKHSDGRALLFATTVSENLFVYDLGRVVAGATTEPVARIAVPAPSAQRSRQWHDMFVGYHRESGQDRLYGAGTGGYHVFDVTDLQRPQLLTSVTEVPGVANGHTFTPTPDGKFAFGISEPTYQGAAIRSFDLRPGLTGEVDRITGSGIGAWMVDYKGASHNQEIRWPYMFVSAQDDGFQVVNIMDPSNPYTQAYYITREGPTRSGRSEDSSLTRYYFDGNIYNGAWGVDVRNADGLIVVSDFTSGFWAFRMEGFDGWNGNNWNKPNISSAQDWEHGPVEQSQRLPYPQPPER